MAHFIPDSQEDGEVINLRRVTDDDEPEFHIGSIHEVKEPRNSLPVATERDMATSDKVKIKFEKFVNLVATHAYEEVFEAHRNEEIVISSDLLADLANAHEEPENKKMPIMFLVGILLGGVLAWIFLKT